MLAQQLHTCFTHTFRHWPPSRDETLQTSWNGLDFPLVCDLGAPAGARGVPVSMRVIEAAVLGAAAR